MSNWTVLGAFHAYALATGAIYFSDKISIFDEIEVSGYLRNLPSLTMKGVAASKATLNIIFRKLIELRTLD